MKEKTVKVILLSALVIIVTVFNLFENRAKNGQGKEKLKVSEQLHKKEKKSWSRSRIYKMKNQPDDNRNFPDVETNILFKGYEENQEAFSWMRPEEWERFKKQAAGYLSKKGLDSVTEANLHPDSVQMMNIFERNIYFDVDYLTDTSDRLVIKTVCDTYKDYMRFGFEIQYGTERGNNYDEE